MDVVDILEVLALLLRVFTHQPVEQHLPQAGAIIVKPLTQGGHSFIIAIAHLLNGSQQRL